MSPNPHSNSIECGRRRNCGKSLRLCQDYYYLMKGRNRNGINSLILKKCIARFLPAV